MSTFAVFGMTRAAALEIARKKTPTVVMGRLIPQEEWERRVQDTTETILRGDMVKQLSPAFDAPQFATQFIEMARRTQIHRGLHIRAKQVLKDAAGKEVYSPKGKKPRTGWLVYTETLAKMGARRAA
jgi:hypothetical protein